MLGRFYVDITCGDHGAWLEKRFPLDCLLVEGTDIEVEGHSFLVGKPTYYPEENELGVPLYCHSTAPQSQDPLIVI